MRRCDFSQFKYFLCQNCHKNKTMFEKNYPYISSWIYTIGWVEIGEDMNSNSMIRLLNQGGLVWQDNESSNLEKALEKAELYLKNDLLEDYGFELEID